jgi:hypothetical protein
MTALGHLVVRELRARGRDPVMPWVRGGAAVSAVLLTASMMQGTLQAGTLVPMSAIGKALMETLCTSLFLFVWFAGLRGGFEAIRRDRQSEESGLLDLTRLGRDERVLALAFPVWLHGWVVAAAGLPVTSVVWLMGGTGGGDLVRVWGLLLSHGALAVAVGMWLGVVSGPRRLAVRIAGLGIGVTVLTAVLERWTGLRSMQVWEWAAAATSTREAISAGGVLMLLAAGLAFDCSRVLPRGESMGAELGVVVRTRRGGGRGRVSVLQASGGAGMGWTRWALYGLAVAPTLLRALESGFGIAAPVGGASSGLSLGVLDDFVLPWLVGGVAIRVLHEARRQGRWEALLSTPRAPAEFLRQMRVDWLAEARWPFLLYVGLHLAAMGMGVMRGGWMGVPVLLVFGVSPLVQVVVVWFGALPLAQYLALRHPHSGVAMGWLLAVVVGVPWVLGVFWAWIIAFSMGGGLPSWIWGVYLLQWGVGLYAVLAVGKWARQQLGRRPREWFAGYLHG